ncbi:MAG: hypothetical protein AAB295_10635 [Chloroflexota bacterium]
MRHSTALLGVLLLGACVSAPTTIVATPSATAAARPTTVAAATPSPSPTPSPYPPHVVAAPVAPTAAPIALPSCGALPAAADPVVRLCPDGVELHIDATIPRADMAVIVAQIADDIAAVQREFAWTLRSRAVIHVLADRDRYVAGLRGLFGYGQVTAELVADNSVAFFEPAVRIIAVNWGAVRERRPVAAIRHELTHVVALEACAPRCDLVPAWLNEGQARLAETQIPGADWRLMRVRYEAASMVATDTLLPLGALVTQLQWSSLTDWTGYYKYQQAARVVELLREDIGGGAIARLYARIRVGETVSRAYASLAGRAFDTFQAELPRRILAAVPSGPGIATVVPGADGTGASYLLYGFPAEAKVMLRVRSRHVDETQEISISPQGAHFDSIDASYPPGSYTISATAGAVAIATSVEKRDGRVRRAPGP